MVTRRIASARGSVATFGHEVRRPNKSSAENCVSFRILSGHPSPQIYQALAIPWTASWVGAFARTCYLHICDDVGLYCRSDEESLAGVIRRSRWRLGKPRKSVAGRNTETTGSQFRETSGNRPVLDWKYRGR